MSDKIKVGIFSPNDARPWVRGANIDSMLKYESMLIDALKSKGVEVIRGGEGLVKEDQIAWNTSLVKKHAKRIASANPDAIILNQGDWTWPYDSRDAVQMFANDLTGYDKGMARVLIYCYKDTKVPGLVAGMAVGGALKRIGLPYKLVFGKIDKDPSIIDNIMDILSFYKKRVQSAQDVVKAIEKMRGQKYLALGGMSLKMCTATADVDQWSKLFGITYDAFDQSELTRNAQAMVEWTGKPGRSDVKMISDKRVEKAVRYIYKDGHGKFDFTRDKLPSIERFIYQLSYYYAAVDLLKEQDGTFMGIKCQDELSGLECTQCVTVAFLNNDVGPEGEIKKPIPVSCENDMDSSLTQLWLNLLNGGKPAGFGDFRDIEGKVLAIVNCGQHPPYFFGGPEQDSIEKLDKVEYMGQEIWYQAGGATVKGRTPGGHIMTVARLYRENLRYAIVAMAVETMEPDISIHEKYSVSWPVILAKTPIEDETVINLWPCNHLGFSYGNLTPQIVEMAERVGIGYTVYDLKGNAYHRDS